jgi:nicotinamidase-related amidase
MARYTIRKSFIHVGLVIAAAMLASAVTVISPAAGQTTGTIVDQWGDVKAPPPVALKPVTVTTTDTAFLILDMETRTCNNERRPRCIASVPKIAEFLARARDKGMLVVYSLTTRSTVADVLPEVAPQGQEPIVKSSVDKFFGTELDKILREKGIKTVIVVGTTAEGAVLHTATGAAMRGLKVIVPFDGVSAGTLYAEQYTAWHLVNAPGSRRHTTLTRFDMIGF